MLQAYKIANYALLSGVSGYFVQEVLSTYFLAGFFGVVITGILVENILEMSTEKSAIISSIILYVISFFLLKDLVGIKSQYKDLYDAQI